MGTTKRDMEANAESTNRKALALQKDKDDYSKGARKELRFNHGHHEPNHRHSVDNSWKRHKKQQYEQNYSFSSFLENYLNEREFTTKERKKDASKGKALPDGSFPIENAKDLENAQRAVGRAHPSKRAAVRRHIAKRAEALGISLKENFSYFLDKYLNENIAMNALKKTIASGLIQQIEVGNKGAVVKKVKPSIKLFGIEKELGPNFLKAATLSRMKNKHPDIEKDITS